MFTFPPTYTEVRTTHPYSFRNGQWALLLGIVQVKGRHCMDVRFPDGARDQWPVFDADEPYDFRTVRANSIWKGPFWFQWSDRVTSGEPAISGCIGYSVHGHEAFGWKVRIFGRAVSFGATWIKRLPEDRLKGRRARDTLAA